MTSDTSDNDPRVVEDALGADLMRIHRESYGAGAQSSKVIISDDAVIVFLDGLELVPSEAFMIGEGHGDAVIELRGRYQQAIESSFRAAVERATGRRVVSFASITRLDPNYAAEIFRLGPATDTPELEERP